MSNYISNTVILNSTHFDNLNKFTYKFPQPVDFEKGDTIMIQEMTLYNSFFNIKEEYNNNKFSIVWRGTTYNFTIPDSYLDATGLNAYIKQVSLINKLYMEQGTEIVSFFEINVNESRYRNEIYVVAIPTSTEASALGWTLPSGASWILPSTAEKNNS